MKKALTILLEVCFVLSVTAAAASAGPGIQDSDNNKKPVEKSQSQLESQKSQSQSEPQKSQSQSESQKSQSQSESQKSQSQSGSQKSQSQIGSQPKLQSELNPHIPNPRPNPQPNHK